MSNSKNKFLGRRELYATLALALPVSAFAAPGNAPVVNILAPNSAGVSHNGFDAFNVDASGLVLNNSVHGVASQLAGQIDGNANFQGRAANLIIAEVIGKNATALNGALEIAGRKAALVIANPNGITADGGSFINASRVTLTTGKPELDRHGRLGAIDVGQGVISVSGKGLDATGVGRADLLARSVELNAKLQARQLSVVTGANKVGYNSGWVRKGEASGTAPTVAVDVGQLGGMYADAIQLVGTEKGVGVNVAGTIEAQKGGLAIDAAGAVNVASTAVLKAQTGLGLSSGRIIGSAEGAGVEIAGQVQAVTGSASVTSTGALKVTDTGSLKGQRDLYLAASDMDNAGALTTVKGNIYARGPGFWARDTSKFVNSGTVSAGGRAYVSGFDEKEVSGTLRTAKGEFLLDEYGHQLKSGDTDHTGSDYKAKWASWMR